MYDAVLLPTDGSEHARRATEQVYVARAHDATIHLLHVVEPIRIRDAPRDTNARSADSSCSSRFVQISRGSRLQRTTSRTENHARSSESTSTTST